MQKGNIDNDKNEQSKKKWQGGKFVIYILKGWTYALKQVQSQMGRENPKSIEKWAKYIMDNSEKILSIIVRENPTLIHFPPIRRKKKPEILATCSVGKTEWENSLWYIRTCNMEPPMG